MVQHYGAFREWDLFYHCCRYMDGLSRLFFMPCIHHLLTLKCYLFYSNVNKW